MIHASTVLFTLVTRILILPPSRRFKISRAGRHKTVLFSTSRRISRTLWMARKTSMAPGSPYTYVGIVCWFSLFNVDSWHSWFWTVLLRQQQIKGVRNTQQLPRPAGPQVEGKIDSNLSKWWRCNCLPLFRSNCQVWLWLVRAIGSAGYPMGARQCYSIHFTIPGSRE